MFLKECMALKKAKNFIFSEAALVEVLYGLHWPLLSWGGASFEHWPGNSGAVEVGKETLVRGGPGVVVCPLFLKRTPSRGFFKSWPVPLTNFSYKAKEASKQRKC